MGKPLAHSYSALRQYDQCPRQYNLQRVARRVKASFGEASIHGNRIHEMLERRLRDGEVIPAPYNKYETLCKAFEGLQGELTVEQELTLNKDLQPTGWWDRDAWLRAKLDVLVIDGENAVVADWKTGKHRPDDHQLEIFALQVFQHYPKVEKIKAVFIWLKDNISDGITYTIKDKPHLWGRLLARIQRVENALKNDLWPAKPSGLCPWCPAKDICEYGRPQ